MKSWFCVSATKAWNSDESCSSHHSAADKPSRATEALASDGLLVCSGTVASGGARTGALPDKTMVCPSTAGIAPGNPARRTRQRLRCA
eukprot:6412409-Prymnesium_polylepis.2